MPPLSYGSPNELLDSLPLKSTWNLGRMQELAKKLGWSQGKTRCVHITGTNGKGSVTAMVSSVLIAAGYKVGTFISPHLMEASERITVNGEKIGKGDFAQLAMEVGKVVEATPQEERPTFFEAATAMAFLHFQRQQVEFAVIEVGMGGRLDSTNIIEPTVEVITNVSLEHTKMLGGTLSQIAREKAGIIKQGTLVATAATGAALEQIRLACREKNAELLVLGKKDVQRVRCTQKSTHFTFNGKRYSTSLLGPHQAVNAALAVEAVQLLASKGVVVGEQALHEGLANTVWRGRLEVIRENPVVVLDGAHNPAAAKALAKAVNGIWKQKKVLMVIGMLQDKDAAGVLRQLKRIKNLDEIIVTQAPSLRAVDAKELAAKAEKIFVTSVQTAVPLEAGLEKAVAQAGERLVVVTGSLYIVGPAIKFLEK